LEPMSNAGSHWNELHANPRFRPLYPNEDVVRFLRSSQAQLSSGSQMRFLDIGAGAGRHLSVAVEMGFTVFGVDISLVGLFCARERLGQRTNSVAVASMFRLPFSDKSFDLAVAYGCFYYGLANEMRQAIAEAWRVLAENGRVFVVLRSTDDYRYAKGRQLEPRTFQLDITDTNEFGTIQHFLDAENISEYFAAFSQVRFEKAESTFCNRTRLNSDWLITAEK
jgi:SAM-dependent methyltransferase